MSLSFRLLAEILKGKYLPPAVFSQTRNQDRIYTHPTTSRFALQHYYLSVSKMSVYPDKVNRAVIYKNPPALESEVVELPIPQPGPGEVLIRM